MSDVKIQIEAVTKGFRDAEQQMRGLGSSVQSVAGSVKALLGLELASYLASAASGALEFAKAGDEARRVASAFVGDMRALRAASAGAVDDTSLQKMDQLARSVAEATGVTQDLNAVLLVASDRFAKGLGGSVGENATAILNGEAEAMRKLGIVIDMADSRLVGLDETRKKAMITQIAAAEAANVDRAAIEGGALSFSQASTAIDNLVSDIQVMAAEFLQSSGVMDIVGDAVRGLSEWFGENRELIQSIAGKALKLLSTGLNDLGPVLKVAADFALLLADGIVTIANGVRDLQNLVNPFSEDNRELSVALLEVADSADIATPAIEGMGNATENANRAVEGLITRAMDAETAAAVWSDVREVFNRFHGDLDKVNQVLEITGTKTRALTALQQTEADLKAMGVPLRDAVTRFYDLSNAVDATNDVMEKDKLLAQMREAEKVLRDMGYNGAAAAAEELDSMAKQLIVVQSLIAKLPGMGDGGKKDPTPRPSGRRKPLEDVFNPEAAAAAAPAAAQAFWDAWQRQTSQQQLEQDLMQVMGTQFVTELGTAFQQQAAAISGSVGEAWMQYGMAGVMIFGSAPVQTLELIAQLSGRLGEMSEQWSEFSGNLGVGADAIGGALELFETMLAAGPEIATNSRKIGEGLDSTMQGIGALATTGLSAMGAFTAGLIDDQKVQAGIMAAIETAQALASWPDPIGMATHFASAALFGAVAAGAFDSAGGGGGGARGAAQAGAAFGAPTMANPFDAGSASDTKETTVIQLQVDGRAIAETTFGGANELNSTFRRPQQLQATAVGAGRKQLF